MNNKLHKIIPVLRFPEFENLGGWEMKLLGNVAVFAKGRGLPKSAILHNGKNPCIHYGELFTQYSEVIEKIKNFTNLDSGFLSENNDVLMPTSDVTPNGLAKASCVKLDNVVLGGDILIIRTHKSKVNGEFLARYIRHLERKVLQLVTGSTVYHLYANSINKLVLFIPALHEQQKIADCLSSLDDLINTQTKKLTALQQHKKGLMQNLFPADGETCPKLRFPEFQNTEDWEIKQLGDVAKILQGHGFPIKYQGSNKGKYPFYKVSDISNALSKGEHFINYATNYVDDNILEKLQAKIIPPNTTIFAKIGEAIRSNRRAFTTVQCVIDNNVAGLNKIKGKSIEKFIFYFFSKVNLIEYSGGAVPSVNKSTIEAIPIFVPKLKEQQKIANCLSSLDNLISTQTKKLTALRKHKKGLMQNLFPNNEALE